MRKLMSFVLSLCMIMSIGAIAGAEETANLADWNGVWNSLEGYLAAPELADAYAELATREESTADEVLAGFQDTYKSDVLAMAIDGNNVSFYSAAQAEEADENTLLYAAEYAFAKAMPTDFGFTWYCFETTDEDATYPVLMLLPVGEDEPGETMRHFHFRYGEDADALFAIEEWWFPTMVKAGTDYTLIANDFLLEEE